MKINIVVAAVLAVSMMLIVGSVVASEYPFGSKVYPGDNDLGLPLSLYAAPNPGPGFSVGYWETGVVAGYDDTDVVYLHQGPRTLVPGVLANDVRLTPFGNLPAGSKVTPQDNDINKPLSPLPAVGIPTTIGWVNLYGGPEYNLKDPVYLHAGPIGGLTLVTTNDVRLTESGGMAPGTKVQNFDPDLPKVFAPATLQSPNPIAAAAGAPRLLLPAARIQYVDVNGNGQYDYPDDVYLSLPPNPVIPNGDVRVNNVRLSGPVV